MDSRNQLSKSPPRTGYVPIVVAGALIGALIGFFAGRSNQPPILPTFPVIQITASPTVGAFASSGAITISGAYVQATSLTIPATAPTMAGMNMSATSNMSGMDMSETTSVYLTIHNDADQPDTLTGISTDAAGSAVLHQTIVQNNLAQMIPLPNGLPVPAKGTARLQPGSYHVMLSQLKADLVPGQQIAMTLTFQSGVVVTLNVPVVRP